MDWGASLDSHWSLDGVVSYVRGKRDDISDNLYRIAPLNGSATLSYARANWWVGLEGVAYARQDNVSETNSETESAGYGLANLRGGIELMRDLAINVGVENIFDKEYENHLSGINRVADSDVAVGERVPGPGPQFLRHPAISLQLARPLRVSIPRMNLLTVRHAISGCILCCHTVNATGSCRRGR